MNESSSFPTVVQCSGERSRDGHYSGPGSSANFRQRSLPGGPPSNQ